MTNEELNKYCCEFAGLEPLNKRALAVCERVNWLCVPEWPRVSADWGAAGRLMDALAGKDIGFHLARDGSDFQGQVGSMGKGIWTAVWFAASGPMALCLAVVELAKANDKQ